MPCLDNFLDIRRQIKIWVMIGNSSKVVHKMGFKKEKRPEILTLQGTYIGGLWGRWGVREVD